MRRRGEKTQPEGRDPSAPAVKDGAGNLVYKLKEERIVRRPIASPGNPNQSFWYNALLAHVATRAESDLNPPHNDFFLQCVMMGVFTTQEELDELINKYARYNLWDECRLNDLRRAVNSSALAAADPLGAADDGAAAAGYAPEVMLAGIDAMREVADADGQDDHDAAAAAAGAGGAAEGDAAGAAADGVGRAARFDPIRRLREIAQQDPAALVARSALPAATMQQLTSKAEAACRPGLTMPLAVPYDGLSADQQAAIGAVMQALHQAQQQVSPKAGETGSEPVIVCLQGGPGTGKSAVTRVLVERAVAAGHKVLVTATAATAAQRLCFTFTDTVDSICQIYPGRPLMASNPNSVQHIALEMADMLVVDELSMMDQEKLGRVLYRLKQSTGAGARRKVLLLVGDLWQLPPVCGHNVTGICPRCHLLHSIDFMCAKHIHLKQVFRQLGDPPYAEFLNYVRTRKPAPEYLQRILGQCFRPREELPSLLTKDVTILCTHK